MAKKEKAPRDKFEMNKGNRKVGYAVAVLVNAVMIWVADSITSWGIPFITDSFTAVQWAFNLSFLAAIIGNLLLILHDPKWFHGFVRLVMNSFGFVVALTVFFIFPFDFSAYTSFNWAGLAKILLVIGLVGSAIGIVVEALSLILRKDLREAKE